MSIDVAGRHYALSILVQVLPMSLGPKNRTGRSVRGTFMNFENLREECVENAELPKAETTDLKDTLQQKVLDLLVESNTLVGVA